MCLKVSRDNTTPPVERILSPAAINAIKYAHSLGKYKSRCDACEPAYMAPSTTPEDYSRVSASLITLR